MEPPPAPIRTSLAALPPAARAHLVANLAGRGPLPVALARRDDDAALPVFAVVLTGVAALLGHQLLIRDLGSLVGDYALIGPTAVACLTVMTTVAALAIAGVVARRRQIARRGFRPGTYLLGAFVVEAGDQLTIEAVARTEVQTYPNGGGYALELHGDTATYRLGVHAAGKLRATLHGLERAVANHARAAAAGATAEAAMWDPLGATRGDVDADRVVLALPPVGAARRWLIAAAIAITATPTAAWLHNRVSDDRMWAQVDTAYAARRYLAQGGRRQAAATARLHRLALDEALAEGSVSALRSYLVTYPASPHGAEAGAAIHARFAAALAAVRAGVSDPVAMPAVAALLTHLEASGVPTVAVHFTPADVTGLAEVDAAMAEMAADDGDTAAPAAPHVSPAALAQREVMIAQRLSTGLGAVVPGDIVTLAVTATAPPPTAPSLEVRYRVGPMVSEAGVMTYAENDPAGPPARRRTYVGLRISFDVTIAVPGAAPFTLPPIEVEPPDTFEVEFMAPAGFAAAAGAMPDDDVYETMITRAFDHLDRALGRTLVGAAPAIR
jgi:hypothetical protein